MKNTTKYYLYHIFTYLMLIFSSGSAILSFLRWKSLSSAEVGIFTGTISIVQVAMMFLSFFAADCIKKIKNAVAVCTIPRCIFFLIMMYVCKNETIGSKQLFILSMTACVINNVFLGVVNVLIYKLPYRIMDIREYPTVSNRVGILSNIISIVFLLFFLKFCNYFEYEKVMMVCFGMCTLFSILSGWIVLTMDEINEDVTEKRKRSFSAALLKLPSVYLLALPNFVRGIAMGIMGMASVVMISVLTDNATISSSLAVISSFSIMCACLLYNHFLKDIRSTQFTLIGGVVMFVSMSLMLAGKNTVVYCVMYFVAYIGMSFVDYSIPVYVTQVVEYENIGSYTSLRMLLTTLGTSVGSYIAGVMADNHSYILLIIGGGLELYVAVSYYITSKKLKYIYKS